MEKERKARGRARVKTSQELRVLSFFQRALDKMERKVPAQ